MSLIYKLLSSKNSFKMSIKTGIIVCVLSALNLCLYEYLQEKIGWYSILSFVVFFIIYSIMFYMGLRVIMNREREENKARMAKARAAKRAKREAQESIS